MEQYNEYAGIQPVYVHTAYELSDDQKAELTEALEKYTGKSVESHFQIDESLIGGVAVRIEDTVIDGTVRYKLDKLEEHFMQPAV
jgi:F-type H+-transporting ATPase subunit delta